MSNWIRSQMVAGRANARRWGAWRCSFFALLSLVGFIALNVAGCGGGGGGGGVGITNPPNGNVQVELRDLNGNLITNGTVTLSGNTVTITPANPTATFANVAPGQYTLTFTANGQTTMGTIIVTNETLQSFVAVPGVSFVRGRGTSVNVIIRLNTSDDPNVRLCNTNSLPVTAPVLVRVRQFNSATQVTGSILAAIIKPSQVGASAAQQGRITIQSIPPGTYRIEVRAAPEEAGQGTAPFSGNSRTFTVPPVPTEEIEVCANQGTIAPGGQPTATPTTTPEATPTATFLPGVPTPTTNTATPTPPIGPLPTATSQPTATPLPTATGFPPPPPSVPTPTATTATGGGLPGTNP